VGTIRCAPSLALLTAVAAQLGDQVEIHIHGVVHHHALPDFDATLAAHPNMIFHGPYSYPDELLRVYSQIDLVWAQDLWQMGNNSDWLLPNRIYEASWAGCPSLAVSTTETGQRIRQDALGWVIDTPTPQSLLKLFASLSPTAIRARAQSLLDRSADAFVQSEDDLRAVVNQVQGVLS